MFFHVLLGLINISNINLIYKMSNKLSDIYIKYNSSDSSSSNEKNILFLITTNPQKFYKNLKSNQNYNKYSSELQHKIINATCDMIKSINPQQVLLGLSILEEIISFIPKNFLENSFTYNKTLTENNYGIFACALEENKEIKIKTLQLVSHYKDKIHTEKHFDFILELINDEEEEVRNASVDCLESLIPKIKIFSYEICEILLFVLKDNNRKLRKKFMKLISKMKFDLDKDKFRRVIIVLKENIKIFPGDKKDIFMCVKNFSEMNSYCLNEKYFYECLSIDENFLIVEYKWNDEFYVVDMIVFQEYIFHRQFDLNMLIPKFFVKHFYYFEEKYPNVFNRKISEFFLNKATNSQMKMEIDDGVNNTEISNDNSSINSLQEIIKNLIYFRNTNSPSVYSYEYVYKEIDAHMNEEKSKNKIIRILLLINFQISIQEKEDDSIEHSYSILYEYNNKVISYLKDKTFIDGIIKTEEVDTAIKSLSNKQIISLNIIHPEVYQIYSDSRKSKVFPFSLPVHIKFENISQPKNNLIYYIINQFKMTLCNSNNSIKKDISFLPSTGDVLSSYNKQKKCLSLKKKELIFLPQEIKQIEQFFIKIYIDNVKLFTIEFHIHI